MNFMKLLNLRSIGSLLLLQPLMLMGQSSFTYDQQSSTSESPLPNGSGENIQFASPYGQSFTPTLSAVDFIRVKLNDPNPNNGLGSALYVNLRSGSIGGTILATSTSVSLPNAFTGVVNFFFSSSVALAPGATYCFQPVVQSGDQWNIIAGEYNYPGGNAFYQGLPLTSSDVWFREGIVPEPSSAALALLGGVLVWFRRRASRTC
jgi:PEP-CTERM motif-containing protein